MPQAAPSAAAFIRAYEKATNSHDITRLATLIAPDATYWFTDGSHSGRDAVLAAIARTFDTIRDEVYAINDLEWVVVGVQYAVCRYRFSWTGSVSGRPRSGGGRGTNVLTIAGGRWQMAHEHLSR